MSRPARSDRPLPTPGSWNPGGGAPSSAGAELGQGRAERGLGGRLCPSSGTGLSFPGVASRRASPTFPIGCIRDVGFESPMTGPDDNGFLPPGTCRPVRAIQVPYGDSRESRNAGLVGGGGGAQARSQEGETVPRLESLAGAGTHCSTTHLY